MDELASIARMPASVWSGVAVGALLALVAGGGCSADPGAAALESPGGARLSDDEVVKKVVAGHLGVSPLAVEVAFMADADVPGVSIFETRLSAPDDRAPTRHTAGALAGGAVELETAKSMRIVLAAWKYGPERTIPPERVAKVLGVLEGSVAAPARPVLDQATIDDLSEKARETVFLPRETIVDGLPAVEYWSISREPPLWLSMVVVQPDGSVRLSRKIFRDF